MGTLTRNTHSQPGPVVSMPLTITPNDAAVPDTAPKTPSALVRAGPSANVVARIDSAAGAASAAPRPCTARDATSIASDSARPAVSDAAANRTSPATRMRLRPSRSAARPPSSRNPPSVRP